jgi:hypothetical protein
MLGFGSSLPVNRCIRRRRAGTLSQGWTLATPAEELLRGGGVPNIRSALRTLVARLLVAQLQTSL